MWVYRSVGKKGGLEGHQRVTTYSVSCSSNGWIASQPIAAGPQDVVSTPVVGSKFVGIVDKTMRDVDTFMPCKKWSWKRSTSQSSPVSPSTAMPRLRPRSPILTCENLWCLLLICANDRLLSIFSSILLVIMVGIPCGCLMLLNSPSVASCVFRRTKMFAGFKSSGLWVGDQMHEVLPLKGWMKTYENHPKQLTLTNSQNSLLRLVNTRTI